MKPFTGTPRKKQGISERRCHEKGHLASRCSLANQCCSSSYTNLQGHELLSVFLGDHLIEAIKDTTHYREEALIPRKSCSNIARLSPMYSSMRFASLTPCDVHDKTDLWCTGCSPQVVSHYIILQAGSISLKYSGALQAGKVSTSQQFSISHSRKICGKDIREAYIPSYAAAVAGHEV